MSLPSALDLRACLFPSSSPGSSRLRPMLPADHQTPRFPSCTSSIPPPMRRPRDWEGPGQDPQVHRPRRRHVGALRGPTRCARSDVSLYDYWTTSSPSTSSTCAGRREGGVAATSTSSTRTRRARTSSARTGDLHQVRLRLRRRLRGRRRVGVVSAAAPRRRKGAEPPPKRPHCGESDRARVKSDRPTLLKSTENKHCHTNRATASRL